MSDAAGRRRHRPAILTWIAILYFAEGLPLGLFYDLFPVHFRQQGVELWKIGFMSLLGLSWTLKFLWAPAVDAVRHHRRWMFAADVLMGVVLATFAIREGFGPGVWVAIGVFTALSATNDIAIDGYSIELLRRDELGVANGFRIGFYRVGMLAAGFLLAASDVIGWAGAYLAGGVLLAVLGCVCLLAPPERASMAPVTTSAMRELRGLLVQPGPAAAVVGFLLGATWLANRSGKWSVDLPSVTLGTTAVSTFWVVAFGVAIALVLVSVVGWIMAGRPRLGRLDGERGPIFGTLLTMLARPGLLPVVIFILTFKLADTSMGFMVKPFWVDAGFTASEIGLVSVNIGLVLSIAGGVVGGYATDRMGIFRGLWVLGLFQALSNLGYAVAAHLVGAGEGATVVPLDRVYVYAASALESFTGGLGTGAFLAFLMAIVNRRAAATEYAILSSVFALGRSVAGWLGGFGADAMGYPPYFLLTFFLAFPAYALLPHARRMMALAEDLNRDIEAGDAPGSAADSKAR